MSRASETEAGLAAGALVGWYLPLFAGALPVLVLGFEASAVANRLVFAGWGLAAAVGYTLLLRGGLTRGWRRSAVAAAVLGWLALAFAGFTPLAARHHEIYDLGLRAVAPALHRDWMTEPRGYAVTAVLLAVAAAGCALAGRRGGGSRAVAAGGEPG